MPRLLPDATHYIPVHPATEGWDVQRLVVERHYFPAPEKCDRNIALLWSHSNGFNKESLHPLMRHFIEYIRQHRPQYNSTNFTFVVWEARNHGDSARLNQGTFRDTYVWFDNVMDTKQVIDVMELKKDHDKLFGVGHSFGATSMLLCEFFYPRTFDGLCLIEPVIGDNIDDVVVREQYPTMASAKRRDTWDSFDDALNLMQQRRFWKRFDPEVLDLYVRYGMYKREDGKVTLKCPKEQETHNFRMQTYARTTGFRSLPTLKIPTDFIYAKESVFLLPGHEGDITSKTKYAKVTWAEGTHMAPNERPKEFAPIITAAFDRAMAEAIPSSRL
ncbi:hypothetical protein RO3G_03422 [Lichtheimia corymbifera JMRC:FSU:9682]|uniref:AB hydrolase-1 domain-containing protein n=1 Tax=Lichtheimia corymbifera JMRC:FSU:9682 TaxID=1263082 RepID=A0A068RLV1_9FUNG|nr:hypothetical protein RO3G_03422 [Lichtheimia corymbifera JMRC:FSU:9682]